MNQIYIKYIFNMDVYNLTNLLNIVLFKFL